MAQRQSKLHVSLAETKEELALDPAETEEFWLSKSHEVVSRAAASLTRQRREAELLTGYNEVMSFRRCLALMYIKGEGVEVGAGDRPWPVQSDVKCFYGDVRDAGGLADYFKNQNVAFDGALNAQTFEGVADSTLDFVLSGHVIEHLPDPIGCIRESFRVLKAGGIYMLAVPDMRFTHDRKRPPTTIEHLLADMRDGGQGTRLQAYEDHVRFVHPLSCDQIPETDIPSEVVKLSNSNMDIHWHAWTTQSFLEMLHVAQSYIEFSIDKYVSVQNENIFVLQKSQ